MKMNRMDRWLAGGALTLAALFGVQLAVAGLSGAFAPKTFWVADYAENPQNLDELMESAEELVLGRVTRVRRGPDLVVRVPGEPEEDRIPTEIATIQVERRLTGARGGAPESVEVFRTGSTKGEPPSAMGQSPPGPAPEGVERPARPSPPSDRTVMLADDPPYERGQRYLLALKPGPQMRVDGQNVQLRRPVSPEGRFLVDGRNRLVPVSSQPGFAREMRGRSLEEVERQVRGRQ